MIDTRTEAVTKLRASWRVRVIGRSSADPTSYVVEMDPEHFYEIDAVVEALLIERDDAVATLRKIQRELGTI